MYGFDKMNIKSEIVKSTWKRTISNRITLKIAIISGNIFEHISYTGTFQNPNGIEFSTGRIVRGFNHGCSCYFNTLRPRQNGRRFPDGIFKYIFLNEDVWISLKISLKFYPKVRINNIPALVQLKAWRRSGDKPLSEPMIVSLLTHICVTRPQWVKIMTRGTQVVLPRFLSSLRPVGHGLNIAWPAMIETYYSMFPLWFNLSFSTKM